MFVSRLRPFAVICALTFATAVPVVAVAGPASAAGCSGSGCNGKSPAAMGCGVDAVTVNNVVDEDHASGGTFGRQVVELRYSRACNASWSRVTASAGGMAHVTSPVAYMGGYKWVRLFSRDEGSLRWRRARRIGTHRQPTIARNDTKRASLSVTMRAERGIGRVGPCPDPSQTPAAIDRCRSGRSKTVDSRRKHSQRRENDTAIGLNRSAARRNAITPAEPHPLQIEHAAIAHR